MALSANMTSADWEYLASHCARRLDVLLEGRLTPSGRARFNCLLSMEQKRALLAKGEWAWHSRPAFLVNATEGNLERSLLKAGKVDLARSLRRRPTGAVNFPTAFWEDLAAFLAPSPTVLRDVGRRLEHWLRDNEATHRIYPLPPDVLVASRGSEQRPSWKQLSTLNYYLKRAGLTDEAFTDLAASEGRLHEDCEELLLGDLTGPEVGALFCFRPFLSELAASWPN